MADEKTQLPAYADPAHPGNKVRPHVQCVGCGAKGCTTAWGPWCFTCNVARLGRLDKQFDALRATLAQPTTPNT